MKAATKPKCLNPACDTPAATRGLCLACYQAALRLVRSGKTTWDQLALDGKCVQTRSRSEWLLSK